jgi:hypothetical protein
MSNYWKTSVRELIEIFRGALIAIIPWIERAKIKWKSGEAYDDWDNIAQALYENIVCSSLAGEVASEYSIAKYDFHYDSYSSVDFILIKSKSQMDIKYAFVSFQSSTNPLDSLKVAKLDKSNKVIEFINLEFEEIEFVFVKNNNGKEELIDEIEVLM